MTADRSFLDAQPRRLVDVAELLALLENSTVRIDAFALWFVDTEDGTEPIDCEAAAKTLMADGRAEVVWTGHCRLLVLKD